MEESEKQQNEEMFNGLYHKRWNDETNEYVDRNNEATNIFINKRDDATTLITEVIEFPTLYRDTLKATLITEDIETVRIPLEESKKQQNAETSHTKRKKNHKTMHVKSRSVFGKHFRNFELKDETNHIYQIIKSYNVGLEGSGPIYGELTVGSMQKVIDKMKSKTNFNTYSRFLDVGSGAGKPNFHFTQDLMGIQVSYGVEIEKYRYHKSMIHLISILNKQSSTHLLHKCNCIFSNHDIMKALTFEPFTHVYMFSCGYVY